MCLLEMIKMMPEKALNIILDCYKEFNETKVLYQTFTKRTKFDITTFAAFLIQWYAVKIWQRQFWTYPNDVSLTPSLPV